MSFGNTAGSPCCSREIGKCKGPGAEEYPAYLRAERRAAEEQGASAKGEWEVSENRGGQRSWRVLLAILKISPLH